MASGAAVTALACSASPPDARESESGSVVSDEATMRPESEIAYLSNPLVRRVARDRRVEMRVAERLDGVARARVMVTLDVPEAAAEGAQTYDHPDFARARVAIARAGEDVLTALGSIEVHHRFEALNAIVVTMTPEQAATLVGLPGIRRVALDEDGGEMHGVMDLQLARLDTVQAQGLTGAGTTVAILDTGIDRTHPDLSAQIVGEACFCSGNGGCCPGGGASKTGAGTAQDDNGHGTNVAGIVAGAGKIAPRGGAPSAQLVAIKVLDSTGSFCCSSDVLAGFDWIISNRHDVKVINASLGTFQLFNGDCDSDPTATPWATAINTLRSNGVLVVSSSGNNGSSTQMALPACVKSTTSVGAVWDANDGAASTSFCSETSTKADQITCFSNSDSSLDMLAPGAFVTSTGLGGGTSTYFGTSQASPYVASCASLLLQKFPNATPDSIERAIKRSPTRIVDPRNGVSTPRLDCADALAALTPSTCTPSCAGKQCGNDGCGGNCGTCGANQACNIAQQCVASCTPSCNGKQCGSDGCGGSCGTCSSGSACNSAQRCAPVCVPSCNGKQCGSDGCGGSCGTCASGATCTAAQTCQAPPTSTGNCAGVPAWDPNQGWWSYGPNEQHTYNGHLYACFSNAFCFWTPGSDAGKNGWKDLGACK